MNLGAVGGHNPVDLRNNPSERDVWTVSRSVSSVTAKAQEMEDSGAINSCQSAT